jgi:hypothetical protein
VLCIVLEPPDGHHDVRNEVLVHSVESLVRHPHLVLGYAVERVLFVDHVVGKLLLGQVRTHLLDEVLKMGAQSLVRPTGRGLLHHPVKEMSRGGKIVMQSAPGSLGQYWLEKLFAANVLVISEAP